MANLIFRKPEFQYSHPGIFTPRVLEENCVWAYWFNKKSGESNEAAAKRGSYNKR